MEKREKEKKRRAVHRVIPLCSSLFKEPSMPEHDTVEYRILHLLQTPSLRFPPAVQWPFITLPSYLSAKRWGRGGVGSQKREKGREREFAATDVTMEKLFRPREP